MVYEDVEGVLTNKNFMIKFISTALFVICGLPLFTTQAQDLVNKLMPQPVPTSPNVASLGKFGDYPVSYFTGLPDISIPLFEVKSGSLSIPITLSYHASGIKPTDVAGWVGLGWALSAGGQVSRSVHGKPDEAAGGFYTAALISNPGVCTNFYYLQYAVNNVSDTEPDLFSYSFPGKSGKFILPGSPTTPNPIAPYLIPYAPVNITTDGGFSKFEITDEHGVLYRFGRNSLGMASTEFTVATNGGNPSLSATTSWQLMEVIAPNSNDQISLSYQNVGNSTTHDVSNAYVILDQCFINASGTCPGNFPGQSPLNVDSRMNQQGVQTIAFKTGKVDFILSTGFRSDMPQLRQHEYKCHSTIQVHLFY